MFIRDISNIIKSYLKPSDLYDHKKYYKTKVMKELLFCEFHSYYFRPSYVKFNCDLRKSPKIIKNEIYYTKIIYDFTNNMYKVVTFYNPPEYK